MSKVLFVTARRSHEPTQGQLLSGNYKKDRRSFMGFDIVVETKGGELRSGVDPDGNEWERRIPFDYGYIAGTEGADGEEVDCFIGPNPEAGTAYVVRVQKAGDWKSYDEDKLFLGFDTEGDVARVFELSYDDERFWGGCVPVPMWSLRSCLAACRGKKLLPPPAIFTFVVQ